MKLVVILVCLVAHSLTAPVPESDSDEIADQRHVSVQLMELYRLYERLLQQGIAAPAPPQLHGFYQPEAAAPLNSDEAEEAEEAEAAEGAAETEVANGSEGAEPTAEEPIPDPTTADPAALPVHAPADPDVVLDYPLATDVPGVEVNVPDLYDPVTATESPPPYFP
ncbi:enamelin [Silurus meridionalis]|uniref:enamelin n=1 Tax=Silurus meridionalis TaxID=175797 RepID=UPI001EECC041|nr:enamelin [Silurus meridionalis]